MGLYNKLDQWEKKLDQKIKNDKEKSLVKKKEQKTQPEKKPAASSKESGNLLMGLWSMVAMAPILLFSLIVGVIVIWALIAVIF